MNQIIKNLSVVCMWVIIASCMRQEKVTVLSAPAGNHYTYIDRDGETVIPNGRIITPAGISIEVAPHPFGLVLSVDGTIAATVNSGISPLSVSVITYLLSENPHVMQIPPGTATDKGVLESVFMGIAISPDNRILYVSGGQANKIFIFNVNTGAGSGFIDCAVSDDGFYASDGYIGDMVLSDDGNWLYAVDQTNFRMMVIDTRKKLVVHNVSTGRYPFGIALSPDETRVYVANVGMFEYNKIPGMDEENMKDTGLTFPAFAFGSEDAREGVEVDSFYVPGLGSPNVPESFSFFTIDLTLEVPKTVATIKTGYLVFELI